jgi:hypothetical protein
VYIPLGGQGGRGVGTRYGHFLTGNKALCVSEVAPVSSDVPATLVAIITPALDLSLRGRQCRISEEEAAPAGSGAGRLYRYRTEWLAEWMEQPDLRATQVRSPSKVGQDFDPKKMPAGPLPIESAGEKS